MAENPVVYQQTKLLNRYYRKIAAASAGTGSCPRFVEFRAGYGFVDESDVMNPILQTIPANCSEIPNEFYRGTCECSVNEQGSLVCKCEIPAGSVSTPTKYNAIGIFDQDSELLAVCTTLPDWVTPTEVERAYPTLTFPYDETIGED